MATSFKTLLVEKIMNELLKFKQKRENPEIMLLVNDGGGGFLGTKTIKVIRPKFALEENYNNDFLPIHKTILKRLRKRILLNILYPCRSLSWCYAIFASNLEDKLFRLEKIVVHA
jgi:hypothetical protein